MMEKNQLQVKKIVLLKQEGGHPHKDVWARLMIIHSCSPS